MLRDAWSRAERFFPCCLPNHDSLITSDRLRIVCANSLSKATDFRMTAHDPKLSFDRRSGSGILGTAIILVRFGMTQNAFEL